RPAAPGTPCAGLECGTHLDRRAAREVRTMSTTTNPSNVSDAHPSAPPELTPEEDAEQRGTDPARTVGPWPVNPPDGHDPDPAFQPDPNLLTEAKRVFDELSKRHRPHREDVLPYLLIRAFSPGDRGA